VSERRTLKFADADAVAAEVRRLRAGYTQAGEWSLPQACWHLNKAIRFSMNPPPQVKMTKPGLIRKMQLMAILIVGRIPAGAHAPEKITPTKDVPESAIDEFLVTLNDLNNFKGEFAPNPLFGQLSRGRYMRLHLVHCAHHLGFLSATNR
jgi:hypothetical protein